MSASMKGWGKVKLKGESQLMPKLCPNCLQPGDIDARYSYSPHFLIYLFTRTTYWHTFYYCRDCSTQLDAYFSKESKLGCLWFVYMVGFVASLVGITVQTNEGGFLHGVDNALQTAAVIGTMVAYIALCIGLSRWVTAFYRRKAPKQPAQATWGPAAYYVGDGALGFGNALTRVFRAARPDWIRALVEANPTQVDDATYQMITGHKRPDPPAEAPKPFAG